MLAASLGRADLEGQHVWRTNPLGLRGEVANGGPKWGGWLMPVCWNAGEGGEALGMLSGGVEALDVPLANASWRNGSVGNPLPGSSREEGWHSHTVRLGWLANRACVRTGDLDVPGPRYAVRSVGQVLRAS